MIRKKHAKVEENELAGSGETVDNKHIDSQEETGLSEEPVAEAVTETGGMASEESGELQTESGKETAKETAPEVSAEAKLAEMQDRYLRLSAEFDNYRKRTLREKIELTKHAGENILISIVPVMDDFERALKSMEASTDCTSMKEGIDLIYNKFRDFLRQNGIKEIEALHSGFNVDLHEAVSKVPVDDESLKGKVVEVVQKGYYIHEKVMRFSKVVVGE
jgi:molecular chaperone GrpE